MIAPVYRVFAGWLATCHMTNPGPVEPDVVSVSYNALREVVKWAYHAARYDGQVPLDDLRALGEPIAALIEEILILDESNQENFGEVRFADL